MDPLVSIGIPIYNEEKYLEQTLNTIVSQDYGQIEILISDNGSNDETQNICTRYAEQYPNVIYHRFPENQGSVRNFEYVLEKANGKYFMWASGHDLWDKNYVQSCVEHLENNEYAVLAVGSGKWIDEEGSDFPRKSGWTDTSGMDVIARYFTVLWGNMHPVLGLINREQLLECPIVNVIGSDLLILSCLSLKGDFLHASDTTWSRREFRIEENHTAKVERYKESDYGYASTYLEKLFPLVRLPVELVKGVFSSKQPIWVKTIIVSLLLITFPFRYVAGKTKPQ